MKFATTRPYADPETAARKLIELANAVEAVQDGRIHIELLNGPMLFELKATPAEIQRRPQARDRARVAGHAREQHLREVHPAGAELFA